MIDKETFRGTEGRIYRYYNQLRNIEKLKNKLVLLWKQKKEVEREMVDLRYLNISVGLNMGIDYSREKVQTSSNKSGESEKQIIKYIDNLEKQLRYIIKKILKTNSKIRELELQVQDMKFNLSMLNRESIEFIEYKYKGNKSIDWIAMKMYGGARSTAYRKREELIKGISQWYNIIK